MGKRSMIRGGAWGFKGNAFGEKAEE